MAKKTARKHVSAKSTPATKRTGVTAAPKPRNKQVKRARLAGETAEQRKVRAGRILKLLHDAYPQATCALHHRSAYELLVATILSAQCTDERVNQVTPNLMRRYPDPAALAAADPGELEAAIRSTGFFRNKTKSLLGMAQRVQSEYSGAIPDTMPDLLSLPGVARKTANCVLGTWFHQNEGIVVDTHVGRIAERLGLTPSARDSKDAERIERDLMELFPRDKWTWLAHALIEHGRTICTARSPKCAVCPLAPDCPSAGIVGDSPA
jgi:endonuclease III